LKLGALSTSIGAVVALAAARALHVGRFSTKEPNTDVPSVTRAAVAR
jgi:hypothetical protein